MKKLLILIILNFGILFSCSSDARNQFQITNMRINHFQQTAVGVGQRLVLQIQEGNNIGTDEWSYFYSNIEGFEYEPGFTYLVSVEKQNISHPPQDSSSIKYILKKLISKVKVENDITFEIRLKSTKISNPPSFVTGDLASHYKILNQIEINCHNLCENLSNELQTKNEVSGIFKHTDNKTISLISILSE